MEKRIYKHNSEFILESGESFPEIEICYHISNGTEHTSAKPVIWITHALTANSNPTEWWEELVGKGKFFDPCKYTIVCANILGSCYGTTGGNSINPIDGEKYKLNLPKITVRDVVKSLDILREHLGIKEIDLLIGGSVGGFQAIEWGIINPTVIKNIALIACNEAITPWGGAFNESQRMALFADETFANNQDQGGKIGVAVARSIALISYRSYAGYNISQKEQEVESNLFDRKVHSYQQYQGKKLAERFCPYSYLAMLNITDSHNIARGRCSTRQALNKINANTLCIGIDSDILFPPNEMRNISKQINNGEYKEIKSLFGHDGFLLEYDQLIDCLNEWGVDKALQVNEISVEQQ